MSNSNNVKFSDIHHNLLYKESRLHSCLPRIGLPKTGFFKKVELVLRVLHQNQNSVNKCAPIIIPKIMDLAYKRGILYNRDYYEFGVYSGYSLKLAKLSSLKYKNNLRFFGFDSFAGLPKMESIDDTREFYEGQYAYPYNKALDNLKKACGSNNKITLVNGYYKDTLKKILYNKYKLRPVSIAYIDCDLYTSTISVLNFIQPLLVEGSLLVFDDWNAYGNEILGEKKAFFEFLTKERGVVVDIKNPYCWHGQIFMVVKKT